MSGQRVSGLLNAPADSWPRSPEADNHLRAATPADCAGTEHSLPRLTATAHASGTLAKRSHSLQKG